MIQTTEKSQTYFESLGRASNSSIDPGKPSSAASPDVDQPPLGGPSSMLVH
jgi:hypothetical protein